MMNSIPDNLVLFDGVCNFCHAGVQFILRHDRQNVFHFASIQSELGQKLYREHGLNPADLQTLLVLSRGQAFTRSDAALEVAIRLGGIWRLFGVFKIVPRSLRDWGYSFFARNRYRWFGRAEACILPTPELRKRFLG